MFKKSPDREKLKKAGDKMIKCSSEPDSVNARKAETRYNVLLQRVIQLNTKWMLFAIIGVGVMAN